MGETCFLNSEMPKIVRTCLSINISTVRHPRFNYSPPLFPLSNHCTTIANHYSLHYGLSPQEGLLGMRRKLRSTFFSSEDLTKQVSPRFRATIFLSPSYLRKAPRTTQKRRYLQSEEILVVRQAPLTCDFQFKRTAQEVETPKTGRHFKCVNKGKHGDTVENSVKFSLNASLLSLVNVISQLQFQRNCVVCCYQPLEPLKTLL